MVSPRSLSVQSKLIAAFVLLTLVTIGVVSLIGYVSARGSLRAASERELAGLQRSKTAMVQTILRSARNEVLSLSASSTTTNAARELLAAYRQLAREPVHQVIMSRLPRRSIAVTGPRQHPPPLRILSRAWRALRSNLR